VLTVTLFTRDNCQRCLEVEEDLSELQEQIPHRLIKINIDRENITAYQAEVPVVEIGPYQLKAPFDRQTLQITLAAARDRNNQLDTIDHPEHRERVQRGQNMRFIDRFFYWLSNRYMLLFNAAVLVYVGLAFLAPVLQASGAYRPARVIYAVYSRLCHQLAFRSWFIYGEQPAYPREAAQVGGLKTYQEATGFDPLDLETAHKFLGNDQLGYKVALCQRDVAIYGAIFGFGLLFSLTGKRIKSLPIAAWVILGMVPIGLDGVSQIVSQLPWDIISFRESTPLLRTITGALFGFTTAWFGFPLVEESMEDTRKVMAVKHAVNSSGE